MRWSYKTVHYELQKEGLLGSAFLDESAVELSLNEYGKAGWELVSILETLDGLIAVFKQPLSFDSGPKFSPDAAKGSSDERRISVKEEAAGIDFDLSDKNQGEDHHKTGVDFLDDFEVIDDENDQADLETPARVDVGTIRIE